MIKIEKITKIYSGKEYETKAIDDLSLEIEEGEFIAIMGESGSGKSTLLNILGGMDTVISGSFQFGNELIHKYIYKEIEKFRKNNIGFVFQNFALMSKYTIYENVEMPLRAKNISKTKRKEIINQRLLDLKIDKLAKKLPSQISGGQQQRAAIARALVSGNRMILADEPTGALDHLNTIELMEIFKKIHEEGNTIVLVTHSKFVASYASRVITLSDGKIIDNKFV